MGIFEQGKGDIEELKEANECFRRRIEEKKNRIKLVYCSRTKLSKKYCAGETSVNLFLSRFSRGSLRAQRELTFRRRAVSAIIK